MFKNRKIPYLNLLPVIIISMLLYKFINNVDSLMAGVDSFFSLISYFIWGFAIAYLLNPAVVGLEKRFKIKRLLSIIIVYTLVLTAITFAIIFISPRIARNIGEISSNIPYYISKTQKWLIQTSKDMQLLERFDVVSYLEQNLASIGRQVSNILNSSLTIIVLNTINVTSALIDFMFGLVVSVYMLKDKEILLRSIKKFLYAFIDKVKVDSFIEVANEMHIHFSKYILGKSLDSFIIGVLCLIGLYMLKAPYALLISLIVGVTNMIPYFGPFVGMIPAGIITLFASPPKVIWVLLFILLLQQFDGWFLGPKILGDVVGLSAFWVIASIVIGGKVFGVMGMLLGVPAAAVIQLFLGRYINKSLKAKDIDIKP